MIISIRLMKRIESRIIYLVTAEKGWKDVRA